MIFIKEIREVKSWIERQNSVRDVCITNNRFVAWSIVLRYLKLYLMFFLKKVTGVYLLKSSHQPLVVSVWKDLAYVLEGNDLIVKVMGFTKISYISVGFSLWTTMSSYILEAPISKEVESLDQWYVLMLLNVT